MKNTLESKNEQRLNYKATTNKPRQRKQVGSTKASNLGIAVRWGFTLKQSAAVILLYCGSGLNESRKKRDRRRPALVLTI